MQILHVCHSRGICLFTIGGSSRAFIATAQERISSTSVVPLAGLLQKVVAAPGAMPISHWISGFASIKLKAHFIYQAVLPSQELWHSCCQPGIQQCRWVFHMCSKIKRGQLENTTGPQIQQLLELFLQPS